MSISIGGSRESPLMTVLGFTLLLLTIFMVLTVPISADYPRMDTDTSLNRSTVNKPVDPILFKDENSIIQIGVGDEWDQIYSLEKGKAHHIFLVGEWVMNESDPITDYDIRVSGPGMSYSWFTESADLMEQVSNEGRYPYFAPEASGKFEFKIIYDERDSESNQSAFFVLIKHIDVNELYSVDLVGRDDDNQEVLRPGWGFEFNTTSRAHGEGQQIQFHHESVDLYVGGMADRGHGIQHPGHRAIEPGQRPVHYPYIRT